MRRNGHLEELAEQRRAEKAQKRERQRRVALDMYREGYGTRAIRERLRVHSSTVLQLIREAAEGGA